MTDRELMQMALDALESDCDATKFGASEALRTRLAQTEPPFTPPAPPQREWQDLTDDESDEIWGECLGVFDCLRMTQAKLKEKNA